VSICRLSHCGNQQQTIFYKDEDELAVSMVRVQSLKHRREIGDPPEDTFQVRVPNILFSVSP